MVVDDSAAMRALFCDILDQAKYVEVVGTARSAEEARDKIDELRPNVLTLDVEMPGMSGIEFLEEIMAEKPMPVVMLSSITQSGTGTAQKALELGAVDCFPKPLNASPEVFAESVAKLGEMVVNAANGETTSTASSGGDAGASSYTSNGTVVALAGGPSCLDTLRQILAAMPNNCPATLVLTDCDKSSAHEFVHKASSYAACKVALASGDQMLAPGTVYIAASGDHHILIEDPQNPVLRLADRDPVNGFRPSADLLFGALARSKIPCIAGLLEGDGEDGVRGLKMLDDTGRTVLLQQVSMSGKAQRIEAACREGAGGTPLAVSDFATRLLDLTRAE
nr:response regulator [Altererythrobacter lutimaris]